MSLSRTCPHCGRDYKASLPACPACGRPPLSRRSVYAATGPRMLLLAAFLFFLVWAVYAFLLGPESYERFRLYFFGLPLTASRIVGTAGAVLFLAATLYVFLRARRDK